MKADEERNWVTAATTRVHVPTNQDTTRSDTEHNESAKKTNRASTTAMEVF